MRDTDRGPFAAKADGVAVAVKVTPKASRTRILGLVRDAEGGSLLAVAVSAPPEDGRANAALIKLLAKEWRVAKTAITIAAGAPSRRKSLHIAGNSDGLLLDLNAWAADIR